MKALRALQHRMNTIIFQGSNGKDLEFIGLTEAIADLEELMNPKNCNRCKALVYLAPFYYCKTLDLDIAHSTIHTFYCNRYEPKETK